MVALDLATLMKNHDPMSTTGLGMLDGELGGAGNDYFVTCPNARMCRVKSLPEPVLHWTRVQLRADGLYGPNEYMLWPQLYQPTFCHLACIPLVPRDETEPYYAYKWMWPDRSLTSTEIAASPSHTLKPWFLNRLKEAVSFLEARITKRNQFSVFPEKHRPQLGVLPESYRHIISHHSHRLGSSSSSKEDLITHVAELRRAWLGLLAYLDYMDEAKPRIEGKKPTPYPHRVIGCFTLNPTITAMWFNIGVPVYHIQNNHDFSNQRILEVVELTSPAQISSDKPMTSSPIVFEGNPISISLLENIHKASLAGISSIRQPISDLPVVMKPKTIKLSPSRLRYLGAIPSQSPRKRKSARAVEGTDGVTEPHATTDQHRLMEFAGENAPPPISFFRGLNESLVLGTNKNPPRSTYHFPDPGLLLNAETPWKVTLYVRQWRKMREICIRSRQLGAKAPITYTNKEWRSILTLPMFESGEPGEVAPDPRSKRDVGKKLLQDLINDALLGESYQLSDFIDHLPGAARDLRSLPASEVRQVAWELSELNFRCDFMSLDLALFKKRDTSYQNSGLLYQSFEPRFHQLTRLFSSGIDILPQPSAETCLGRRESVWYNTANPQKARQGLASPNFTDSMSYVEEMYRIMHDWKVTKPSFWNAGVSNPEHFESWCRSVVLFYAQTFYNQFSRPAVLPRTLSEEDCALL